MAPRPKQQMSKKNKNLKEEAPTHRRLDPRNQRGGEDPTQRIIAQNDAMLEYLENMTNSLNAMVYYATKSRGATSDIEKSVGSAFVTEASENTPDPATLKLFAAEQDAEESVEESTMQGGKEQTYPSVDATDQRTDFPGTDDRVADPRNLKESKVSMQELKNLIREQLFITRNKK